MAGLEGSGRQDAQALRALESPRFGTHGSVDSELDGVSVQSTPTVSWPLLDWSPGRDLNS